MKIYKYEIPIPNEDGISEVLLPVDAYPVSVGLQNDRFFLWARTDGVSVIKNKVSFIVINTGRDYPYSEGRFIGTVISSTGVVWHVLLSL